MIDAKKFNRIYDQQREDEADILRGEFLKRFPIESLPSLTLGKYAIGQNKGETFCHWVEHGTDKWARITGATASKFGVYFGHEGKSPEVRYRYTKKFAGDLPLQGEQKRVFRNIRAQLLSLVRQGQSLDFQAIDSNPLSQMLKAKILSLYFRDHYLPICSSDLLNDMAEMLEFEGDSLSRIQHEALLLKQKASIFHDWSSFKLAYFLRKRVSGDFEGDGPHAPARPPRKPIIPNLDYEPNFEELERKAREKGEKSEKFARQCEESRLRSRGLEALIPRIQDRTKKPKYGYDFESFSSPEQPRYIEVKTFTGSRFFLSANELRKAQDDENGKHYFFYLVTYDKAGEPEDCLIYRAEEVLDWCDLKPQNFMVVAPTGFAKHLNREPSRH
ncbi:MAG TPA: DUF3883 domain-containing protein [Castellaniella sp.]|uniref:DUF3883 domain-containing protein n=1 Tax=Castellaniella sp. TaxID=1955812 RepID=UPI002EE16A98